MRGRHKGHKTAINDEKLRALCLVWIRTDKINKRGVCAKNFCRFVKQTKFFTEEMKDYTHNISLKTARRWLGKLGLVNRRRGKGLFFDGHEREDVLRDRRAFLKKVKPYRSRMKTYEEKTEMVMIDGRAMKKTTWIVHEPELKGQHEIVLLVQDESIVESERCASAYFERGKGAGKEKGKDAWNLPTM